MQENNTPDRLWERFAVTGRVSDYLRYRAEAVNSKEERHGNDHEHSRAYYTREQQYR